MSDHYTLEVLVGEHQYEMRRNADNYRLLREGRVSGTASLRAMFERLTGSLACRFSGWRYRIMVRVGAVPQAQPCS
jgi:hypothetical protein